MPHTEAVKPVNEFELRYNSIEKLFIELRDSIIEQVKVDMQNPNYQVFGYMDGYQRGKIDLINSVLLHKFDIVEKSFPTFSKL